MDLFGNTKIDFLKYKFPAMIVSLTIIIAGILLISTKGLRYGVDFSGGTAVHLKFRNPVSLDSIRNALKQGGYADSGVQGFNDPTQVLVRLSQKISSEEEIEKLTSSVSTLLKTQVIKQTPPAGKEDLNLASRGDIRQYLQLKDPWNVKAPEKYEPQVDRLLDLREQNVGLFPQFEGMQGVDPKIVESLRQNFYISDVAILSTEYVGPQVGAELRQQARLAIVWSLAGLLVYIWFRFQFLWGISAVVCLAHDVLITLAFFSFFDREISLTVVAAFLTIVGFSLNDTIVIYDRVRDNLKTMRAQPLEGVINLTLNQMLNRTILTNGTVLVVVIVLYIFGGEVINDFAFAMLIGSITGTFSTIYIASALIVLYEKYFGKKKKAQPVKARSGRKVV